MARSGLFVLLAGGKGSASGAVMMAEAETTVAAAETVTLMRGVSKTHPGFNDALNGVAKPRGGSATPAEHNAGNTQSPYTSWTTRAAVARKFAKKGGVIMTATVPKNRTVKSPDIFHEGEVLIQGEVKGAQATIRKK